MAYQVPYAQDDAELYLLGSEDFGKVVILSLVADNCNIVPIDINLFREVSKISNVSHIPTMMITTLLPILSGSSAAVPLNPGNWTLVLDGRFAKCCPRIECNECKFKRLVTPRLMSKYTDFSMFSCKNMGLTCYSFVQTQPCDDLRAGETKDTGRKEKNVEDIEIMTKTDESSMISNPQSSS